MNAIIHRTGGPRTATVRVALATILLAGCGGAGDPEPVRIGATMSLTGAYAVQGVPAANGYRLCVDDLNGEGGLLGRRVELVLLDDASDSDTAIRLYEELLDVERVDAVLGSYGSTLTEAVAPVTEARRQVHVSPLAATTSIWEQGRRYLFMVLPPAELFLAGLIELAVEHGYTRVAIVHEEALFPRAAAAGAAALARERGMEVVLHAGYAVGTRDFGPILDEVRGQGAEVVAMAASTLSDFSRMVRQMRERGVAPALFGTSGAVAEFVEELGADADGTFGLSAWEPTLPHPGIPEFVEAYQGRYGQLPSFHAAGAYGACRLFAEAVTRAGTLDADALREELLRLEITTLFGPYAVDERGYQTANRGVFIQWRGGEKVVVWPPDLATGEARVPGWGGG